MQPSLETWPDEENQNLLQRYIRNSDHPPGLLPLVA
jgi:hypothetical protein